MTDSPLRPLAANQTVDIPALSRGPKLHGRLTVSELFWRDRYDWLLQRGYRLRSRYKPDWKPSWEGTNKIWFDCSDGVHPTVRSLSWQTAEDVLLPLDVAQ